MSGEVKALKISTKGRYGLRMMIDIAEHDNGEWVTIKEISRRQGISMKYLEQIAPRLTHASLLRSERGSQGGYRLMKMPWQYTAGEILRATEGELTPISYLDDDVILCERNDICSTFEFWKGLGEAIDDYVDSISLQEMISNR